MTLHAGAPDPESGRFVSTGALPGPGRVQELLDETHALFADDETGAVSTVYPALSTAPSEHFGLAVANVDGTITTTGHAAESFTIMSVAKPFVFALVCASKGPAETARLIGVDATGLPFDSITAVERDPDGRTNPMVNPGAIAATSHVPGSTLEERWDTIADVMARFAGHPLVLDEDVLTSATAANHRNRAMARLLHNVGALGWDPDESLEIYTRQSCLRVTASDLAVMGATLADGGVNPVTGEQVVDALTARCTLAVMATAGLYETSGTWLYEVGLPGKSGVGGGIVTVSPGKGALGTYSPLLDDAGNSVRGQRAASHLSAQLGLDLFASEPVR